VNSLKYAWLTIKHKWFVFLAGLKTGASILDLLLHDMSKFTPSELKHYGRQFFGGATDPDGFLGAWIHHQNTNKHHWEYWIPRTAHSRSDPPTPDNEPIPMPKKYVNEMVADWMGAGRAYEGKWPNLLDWEWLNENKPKMNLHPITKVRIEMAIHRAAGLTSNSKSRDQA